MTAWPGAGAGGEVTARIWAHDTELWTDDPDAAKEVADRLGWLDLPRTMPAELERLQSLAGEVRADGIERVLVCGMGGSSLCVEVLAQVLGPGPEGLPVRVLDLTHPDAVAAAAEWAPPASSLYVIASKSGTTTEPNDFAAFFEARAAELGDGASSHFVAITDPGSQLAEHARQSGYRAVLENPPDIGGRYSALSLFGLAPAALLGADVGALLERAGQMVRACGPEVADGENPAVLLGRFMAHEAMAGRDKLTLLTPPGLASLGLWVEQLVAESTGKLGKGLLPVVGEPATPVAAFAEDRAVVGVGFSDGRPQGLEALAEDHPVLWLELGDGLDLGGEFFRWEFATAVAGHLLGINAFDQPDVQAAKDATKRVLAAGGAQHDDRTVRVTGRGDVEPAAARLRELLAGVGPGRYIALMAYLPDTAETQAATEEMRSLLRDATRAATTVGFGPRFLHSTGQYHKGGPPTGVFLQLTGSARQDLEVPGRGYSFGTLVAAQAAGDRQALRDKGRDVLQLDLGEGAQGLEMAVAAVRAAVGSSA